MLLRKDKEESHLPANKHFNNLPESIGYFSTDKFTRKYAVTTTTTTTAPE